MRNALETASAGYPIYDVQREEYRTDSPIPFRVTPTPFTLNEYQKNEIHALGTDIVAYFYACDELYKRDGLVRTILNKGKPEIFLVDTPIQYPFVRPDVIITPDGFSICEIETSPFGLALAEIINRAYRGEGYETMIGDGVLADQIQRTLPAEGTLVYTRNTKSFQGQLSFLADKIFTSSRGTWNAENLDTLTSRIGHVFRGFYLSEYKTDSRVRDILEIQTDPAGILPTLTPHMEEKALLALIWDVRWEEYFRKQLGNATYSHLKTMIPPTWIVGEEQYFSRGLPGGVETSVDLAYLTRARRAFVLKSSGFSDNGSWCQGVHFLHRESSQRTKDLLRQASADESMLYVIQDFRETQKFPILYEANDGVHEMQARVRLTPYYATDRDHQGNLIAIKATGVENSLYIHATTSSVNTAVR